MRTLEKERFLNSSENIRLEKRERKKGYVCAEHIHKFVELVYITEGVSVQYIDGVKQKASKGDLLFINYNQVHKFEAETDFSHVDILLTPSFMSDELLDKESIFEIFSISLFKEFVYENSENLQYVHFEGSRMLEIETIIKDMLSEFNEKQTGYISILAGYMRVLFSKLLREMQGKDESEEKCIKIFTPDIMEYIDKHCFEEISLSHLAQKCFYTPPYFSVAFKKYCGISLSDYIKKKRIAYACELLENTDLPVLKICELVGYRDKTFFYKIFKDSMGKSPAQYRNSLK